MRFALRVRGVRMLDLLLIRRPLKIRDVVEFTDFVVDRILTGEARKLERDRHQSVHQVTFIVDHDVNVPIFSCRRCGNHASCAAEPAETRHLRHTTTGYLGHFFLNGRVSCGQI